MKQRLHYVQSPIFISALIALLVNDFILKELFPSLITGKLSDFAGVIVLTLILHLVQDRLKWLNILVVVVFFTWWKSPFSQGTIEFVNSILPYSIGRVVDYTDLFAFALLPLTLISAQKVPTLRIAIPVLAITAFAFAATSRMPAEFMYANVDKAYMFKSEWTQEQFVTKLNQHEGLYEQRKDTLRLMKEFVDVPVIFYALDTAKYFENTRRDIPNKPPVDSCYIAFKQDKNKKLKVYLVKTYLNPNVDITNYNFSSRKRTYGVKGKIKSANVQFLNSEVEAR